MDERGKLLWADTQGNQGGFGGEGGGGGGGGVGGEPDRMEGSVDGWQLGH